MTTVNEPVWRTALSGAQILFVAFGATVLVPLLTGLNPSLALLGAGVGTLIFQICTKRQVPIYLGSSFAFIAPVIYSAQTWGMPATFGALACASFFYYVAAGLVKWRGVGFIHRLLPPVVIGPIIMIIGLTVATTAAGMAMGQAGGKQVFDYHTALWLAVTRSPSRVILHARKAVMWAIWGAMSKRTMLWPRPMLCVRSSMPCTRRQNSGAGW